MPAGSDLGFAGARVGLLDTGVSPSDPRLANRIERFRVFDPSGFSSCDADPRDPVGHGTLCATLICHPEFGLSPSSRLCVGVVIEDGNILARLLSGLDWLVDRAARVVCLPIGIPGMAPVLEPAIRALTRSDSLVVVASGNSGAGVVTSPGDIDAVLCVGAWGADGRVPAYSGSSAADRGVRSKPDIVAMTPPFLESRFQDAAGTSAAAAVAAGAAAALRTLFPQATAGQVRQALEEGADPMPIAQRHRARRGVLQVDRSRAILEDLLRHRPAMDRRDPGCSMACDGPLPFHEPELLRRLERDGETALHEVVLVFADHAVLSDVIFEGEVHPPPGSWRTRILRHSPICIVRRPAHRIRRILRHAGVKAAAGAGRERHRLGPFCGIA